MTCRLAAAALLALAVGCGDSTADRAAPAPAVPSPPQIARGRVAFVDGYQRAGALARSEGKPMLVFFTASWCDYCHQMANEAFAEEQVVRLSQRFLCILVDADAEPAVCHDFGIRGYPTVLFLSPDGMPLNRVTGKRPGHQLAMEMQAALQAIARREVRDTTRY